MSDEGLPSTEVALAALRAPARLAARTWTVVVRHDVRAQVAMALLAALLLTALPFGPSTPSEAVLVAPSWGHWFGTDEAGRDVLRLLGAASRTTLLDAAIVTVGSLLFGTALGSLGAVVRSPFEGLLMRMIESVSSVPTIFVVLVCQLALGSRGLPLVAVVTFVRSLEIAWVAHAETIRSLRLDHVLAARALGATSARTLSRHVLPFVLPTMLTLAPASVSLLVFVDAALPWIGGESLRPGWGELLWQGHQSGAWWLLAVPAVCLVAATAATGLLTEAMREALDPRLGGADPSQGE